MHEVGDRVWCYDVNPPPGGPRKPKLHGTVVELGRSRFTGKPTMRVQFDIGQEGEYDLADDRIHPV